MILEIIKIALQNLNSNKLRSLLSMLGVVIGVAAVIAVVSIASGTQEEITSRISDLGSNLITINPGISRTGPGRISSSARDIFTLELGSAILNYCPSVTEIVPNCQKSGLFIIGENNYSATLVGTGPEYQDINKYYPAAGKFFNSYDLDNATSVIVLGSELAGELFKEANPLGKKVAFFSNNHKYIFTVIGVMEEKDMGISGDLNSQAYIPVTTYLSKISSSRFVTGFLARARSSEEAPRAVEEIEYLLKGYLESEEKFRIFSQDQLLDTINEITETMKFMLGGIAGISLLVGGIGIMNIMLVSVTERTREIGIRKALGAKKRHILNQFLVEALVISGLGGILGIILGWLGALLFSRLGGWQMIVTENSVIIGFGFSLLIGIFFGIYPARKAAALDPVDALSYE